MDTSTSAPASLASGAAHEPPARSEGITRQIKVYFYDVSASGDFHLGAKELPSLLKRLPEMQMRDEVTTHYIKGGKVGVTISDVSRDLANNVTTFRMLRGKLDKSSESIVNLRARSVVPLDEKLVLEDDEGIGASVVCCWDHTHKVLAIYSAQSPSITDIEGYFTQFSGKKFDFILIKDPDSEKVFESMDVKKLIMRASIPKIEKFAPEFTGEPAGVPKRQIELIDFAKRFNGGRVVLEVTADREDAVGFLKKEAIREEIGALKRLLRVTRRGNQATVQGRVVLDSKTLNNRVVDLIDGLLIWQDEIKLPSGYDRSMPALEDHIKRAVKESREYYGNSRQR